MRAWVIAAMVCAGCAPEVQWARAPDGASSAIWVAEFGAPEAVAIDATLRVTLPEDAKEIAYYRASLDDLGLTEGPVQVVEGGAPLDSADAIYLRETSGAWRSSSSYGPLLEVVRIERFDRPSFCFEFESVEIDLPPFAARALLTTNGPEILAVAADGRAYLLDAGSGVAPVELIVSGSSDLETIISGARIDDTYLLGTLEGTIWRADLDRDQRTLQLSLLATTPGALPVTEMAGTLEPFDLHVLINAGHQIGRVAQWSRFDGAAWTEIEALVQHFESTKFDLLYVSAQEVYATSLELRSAPLRFDGSKVWPEDSAPLASFGRDQQGRVVGGGYGGVHVRGDGAWTKRFHIENLAFPDEGPLEFTRSGDLLVALGKSFVVVMNDREICPVQYLWPSLRYTLVAQVGDDLLVASPGRPEGSPVKRLRRPSR